jgi:hypothetical protein
VISFLDFARAHLQDTLKMTRELRPSLEPAKAGNRTAQL